MSLLKEGINILMLKGESIRKTLMKTPIDGARLSSRFGKRRHPVLGFTKMHKGVDFAAKTGTPIYAAGDGVIERANVYGGYGKYIELDIILNIKLLMLIYTNLLKN